MTAFKLFQKLLKAGPMTGGPMQSIVQAHRSRLLVGAGTLINLTERP
jgi:hypothetical protein